jgi:dTDP-glucose 4,6-dehydratase
MPTSRVLITGACGFIGHHVAEAMVAAGHDVVCLDRIDQTSTQHRLLSVQDRVRFVWHDLKSPINEIVAAAIGPVDAIFHLAASTHVDRSIESSLPFVLDNVVGTANLLEYARSLDLALFLNFSTDEVFGPAPNGVSYKECDRYDARNPYSATKAGAEELAHAYANTYGVPVISTHCMNVFGERQHPEKFVPMVIGSVLQGRKVTIHADHDRVTPGSRFYIYGKAVAALMVRVLEAVHTGKLSVPDKLNIPGALELDNLAMAKQISECVGKPLDYELVDFHSTRPGHDLRYALDDTKITDLGILKHGNFEDDIARTVAWYLENRDWLLL